MKWVKVAKEDEVPEGTGKMVHGPEDNHIAIFNIDGDFYAVNHVCPHQGGPLSDGVVTGHEVTCPWHGWSFDLRNGKSSHAASIDVYEVKVEDGHVFIGGLKKGCCGGGCCKEG